MRANKIVKLIIVVIFLNSPGVFAAVKNSDAKTQPAVTDPVYTEEKPNLAVTIKQPQFVIKLKSNPTTGYAWFLREYDSNLITPVKHRYEVPDKKLIGAPGFELWTFRMKPAAFIVPQQTTVRMIYARPWQGSDSATQVVFRISTQGK